MALSDNLIAHWKMDDNAGNPIVIDYSGNGHHGAAQQNTSALSVAGRVNTALGFNGTSDYIEIPDHADFTFARKPFSVSALIKAGVIASFPIVGKEAADNAEWKLILEGCSLYWTLYSELNAAVYTGRLYNVDLTVYQDLWIHIVATSDGGITCGGCRIYLNGIQVDNEDNEAGTFVSMTDGDAPVWIGRIGKNYADGLIDNVMIFNKVLSVAEIFKLSWRPKPERTTVWRGV